MKPLSVLLFVSAVWLPSAGMAKKDAVNYPATYAGGSLDLSHQKVYAAIAKDEVVFIQGSRRIAVPVKNITAISCGTEVRRRLGASVLDVVPMMHLGEAESYYIGVAWTASMAGNTPTQVLLKLSRADYRDLLAALEHSTGIKAVDTNQVPTVVRYQI
jgi:hypothetical protein